MPQLSVKVVFDQDCLVFGALKLRTHYLYYIEHVRARERTTPTAVLGFQ